MTYLSLFSGIGGLDLGLDRAGMTCLAQCEIDPFARAVIEKHWPNVPKYTDVTKLSRRIGDCLPENDDGEVECPRCGVEFSDCACIRTDQFTDEHGFPDLIVGGDPCQGNSNAKTHGKTADTLGGEFIRIVAELRPRFVLRENPATVKQDAPWPARKFAIELIRYGYASVIFPMRACCCGAGHRRARLFVFSQLQDANGEGLERDVGTVMEGAFKRRQNPHAARPDWGNPTPRVCRGVDGIPRRVDRLRTLGNAVCPAVSEVIGRAIMAADARFGRKGGSNGR